MKTLTIAIPALAVLAGCQSPDYLYYQSPKPRVLTSVHQDVKKLIVGAVDILWIIDNSGSMEAHQQDVIDNTKLFLTHFLQSGAVRWKMGLISTDTSDMPYVGFTPSTALDDSTADPVTTFQDAVERLGIDGSGTEKGFEPVENVLRAYPNFTRPGATLALIYVTDAPEQSDHLPENDFLKFLVGIKGDVSQIVTYGAFGAMDLGCEPTDDPWNLAGSPYGDLVKDTNGDVFPLCTQDFGTKLAQVGESIRQHVSSPRVFLSQPPVPSTIRVEFQGVMIPGGTADQGGDWLYDFRSNSIIFSSLDFAKNASNASVDITFQVDDGSGPG